MGRYDKIKVYKDGSWKQPSRIRVYSNGAWRDLGDNLSSNTNTLNARKNGVWVRATLNRKEVQVVGDKYINGAFSLLPAAGFCFCPTSDYTNNATWSFRCTMRKTSNSAVQVFRSGSSSNHITVTWNANGSITVTNTGSFGGGRTDSITTSNKVTANTWVVLDISCSKNTSTTKVVFNGVTTTGGLYATWQVSNATNTVGATGLQFKNTLSAQGVSYTSGACSVSFNASTASGTNSQYKGVTHKDESTTTVQWV